MKKLPYLLLALMLSFVSASAQTLDVAPYDASHFNRVSYVNPHNLHRDTIDIHWSDTTLFLDKQKSFLFGYHWGGGDNTVMERRWHINAPHDGNPAHYEFDSTNTDFETALPGRTVHYIPRHDAYDWFVEHHLYTPVMEWRPAITGWRSDGEAFSPVASDSTGAIFGFEERAVGISQTDSSQPHFMDYQLRTSDLDSVGTPVLALRRPVWRAWPMRRGNAVAAKTDTTSDAYHEAQWNGTRWYAAINLGRLNNYSAATDTAKVMKIRIQYWYYDTTNKVTVSSFIRFDSVFIAGQSSTVSTGRGKTFGHLTPATGDSTAFIIRRSDLPAYSATDTSGMITLAAFFRTSPIYSDPFDVRRAPNVWFKIENGEVNAIDSFDIQVTYHGGCDVAVRHISLQTPTGRSVLFGGYDTVIARNIDRAVRQFRRWQSHYPTKTLRLFRFYGVDEAPRYNWRMHRYYNKLMDKRLTTEVDHDAYRHAVPQRDYWSGSSATVLWRQNAPFVNKFHATPDAYMPTHPGGWLNSAAGITPYNYECRHCEDGNHIRWEGYPWIAGRSFPNVGMAHLNSFGLCLFESLAAIYALTPLTLYSPTPNWTRHTLTKWYTYGIHIQKVGSDTVYRPYFHPDGYLPREQTGEEVRRAMWYSVLMGTKGLNIADGTGSTFVTPYDTLLKYIRANPAIRIDTIGTFEKGGYINFGLMYPGILPDYAVAGDTTGEATVRSPATGHDFITPTSLSNYWQYVRRGDYAAIAGIDSTRLYIGMRSMRIEIMKMNDYIIANEADIMKMKLMAWSGKGFNWLRSARDNDTTLYARYVNMGWNGVKARTIGGKDPEPWDTAHTFVDVTLHKSGETSLDSVFIIGVLNRHGNSLVMVDTNTAHADSVRYKFFSTAEFDSLSAMPGGFGRYAQLGSREITIPFNYADTLGRYALLRVRELGGGLDTVVGQDRSIIAKFLPGQGRFYKVEVLRSNEPVGDLSHSNQTKIVSHNIMRHDSGKWEEGDSLIYYMTYHRQISGIDRRSAVYFRVAQPTSRWDNNAALQWGTEYLLSDSVYHSGRINLSDTCGFPSIVTRFDSVSREYRAHVVFGCASSYNPGGGAMPDSQFICEAIGRVRSDGVVSAVLGAKALDYVAGRTLPDWGTPMINASDSANFYCYADKYRGIIAGWNKPDTARTLLSTTRISWADTTCAITAQHPSMNPYSPYIRGEKHSDCALVWQESDTCTMTVSQIHYTRLFITNGANGQIFHDLPPNIPSTFFFANADTSILCVSCDTMPPPTNTQHYFPVVYRDLFNPDTSGYYCDWQTMFPGHTRHDLRVDNIAWQSGYYATSPFDTTSYYINRRVVYAVDTTIGGGYIPDVVSAFPTETIWSSHSAYLIWPTIAAGEAEYSDYPPFYGNTGGCLNFSIRSVAIDFTYYPMPQMIGQPPWSAVYHTALPTWAVLASIPITTIAEGNTPTMAHLSARGTVYLNDWQRGRHIYNSDTLIPPTIRTSGKEFYKKANSANPTAETLYGFGSSDSRFVVGTLQFGGKDYPLQPKRALAPSLFPAPPDTLVTAWFTVGQSARARLSSAGDAPELTEVWLERRSDGSRWLVQMGAGERRRLARLFVRLENGNDEEYRLEILNAAGGAFRRETVLNADNEGLERGTPEDNWLINLGATADAGSLSIFPNPAAEEVHIAVRGEGRAAVTIVNALGQIMWQTEATSGGVLTVRTAEFAAGLYAVRVQRAGLPETAGRFAVAR